MKKETKVKVKKHKVKKHKVKKHKVKKHKVKRPRNSLKDEFQDFREDLLGFPDFPVLPPRLAMIRGGELGFFKRRQDTSQ